MGRIPLPQRPSALLFACCIYDFRRTQAFILNQLLLFMSIVHEPFKTCRLRDAPPF